VAHHLNGPIPSIKEIEISKDRKRGSADRGGGRYISLLYTPGYMEEGKNM
jgi:hypothetical protein